MANPTEELFAELNERGHVALMDKITGTVRVDLDDGKTTEHWLISVNKGDIDVSRSNAMADGVFRTDKALFDRFASGEANIMAAMLRGAATAEGDAELLVLFQRIFPTPASSHERRTTSGT